jgi:hypothetical protein
MKLVYLSLNKSLARHTCDGLSQTIGMLMVYQE